MVNLNLADYQAPSLIRANIVEVRTSVINLNDSIIYARDFNYIQTLSEGDYIDIRADIAFLLLELKQVFDFLSSPANWGQLE